MVRITEDLFGIQIEIRKRLKHKKTARCPYQYLGRDNKGKQYLIVEAKSSIQKFYLKRSVDCQNKTYHLFNKSRLCLNLPVLEKDMGSNYYVIYPYFERVMWSTGPVPEKELLELYKNHARTYSMADALLEEIRKEFLSAWPEVYHTQIEELASYQKYVRLIRKLPEVTLCFEHGDYTTNNILLDSDGTFWLVDFEFFKLLQPIGSDLFDWHYTSDQNYESVPYYEINFCKHRLMDEINDILDAEFSPLFTLPKLKRGGGKQKDQIGIYLAGMIKGGLIEGVRITGYECSLLFRA